MFINFPAVFSLFFLKFLARWSASCSRQPVSKGNSILELAPHSIALLTDRLKSGVGDRPAADLRHCPSTGSIHWRLCLKYLIGAVAVFGHVSRDALGILCGLHGSSQAGCLKDLLGELAEKNNGETVLQFIVASIRRGGYFGPLGDTIKEMVEEDWSVMKALVMKVLDTLKGDASLQVPYYLVLRQMPVERQYEIINTESTPPAIFGDVYFVEGFDAELREIFALARCSYNPNQHIREHIANSATYFRQFLPDHTLKEAAASYPDNDGADPRAHVWDIIYTFMDIETLTFVLPLVCTSWRRLHSRVLTHSSKIHDMYLQDLSNVSLSDVSTITPWKHCLPNRLSALRYLGCCVAKGALSRARFNHELQEAATEYLKAVADGEIPQRLGDDESPYQSFLRLFEAVCEFCTNEPILHKPCFFTDSEYEQAVHYFVCERGWIPGLHASLVADNMPRLFSILKKDHELMRKLLVKNFDDFTCASVVLVLHKKTEDVPEELAKLVFSQTDLFRRLIEPELVHPSGYYDALVESDIFSELVIDRCWMAQVHQLTISLVLSLKDDFGKIDQIAASMARRFSMLNGAKSRCIRKWLNTTICKLLDDAEKYSSEDFDLVARAMSRFGWTKEAEV